MAEPMNNLSRKQKLALTGLSVFAVLIIGLWIFNLNQEIRRPLALKNSNGADQSAAADEAKLKAQDTDGDGLSDWDELHIYNTSPYLADSDSDGIPDGAEVKNGTDPNDCNSGGTCPAQASGPIAPAPSSAPSAIVSPASSSALVLSGQSDAATLRQALIAAGVDKNQLEVISDEVLLKTYKDMIASSTKK